MDAACYSKTPNYARLGFYAGQIGSVTDVSGQPTGHTFEGQAAQECRPRNVDNKPPIPTV